MAIMGSVSRLAGTLIGMLQTRLELAAVELEEETQRFFFYFLWALGALFCLCMAIMLSVLLIVVAFWDTYRIAVLVALIAVFGLAALMTALGIRKNYRLKPKLLSHTLSELDKDVAQLHSVQNGERTKQ